MSVLYPIIMAFACFSAIPMPHVEWNDRTMRYMMAAFPLVGLIVGLVVWLWHLMCGALGVGSFLHAVGLGIVPLVVTGGIHMDGFADVVDAQSSHAPPEKKRAILKDPHVGAFAIIGIVSYVAAYCGLASELLDEWMPLLCLTPIVSRCFGALLTVCAHPSHEEGMLAVFQKSASVLTVRTILSCMLVASTTITVVVGTPAALAVVAAAALALAWTLQLARREFGGMSGDLVGCYIQIAEIAMLACIIVLGKLGCL